jgi:hypothetical protein
MPPWPNSKIKQNTDQQSFRHANSELGSCDYALMQFVQSKYHAPLTTPLMSSSSVFSISVCITGLFRLEADDTIPSNATSTATQAQHNP